MRTLHYHIWLPDGKKPGFEELFDIICGDWTIKYEDWYGG